MYKFILRHGIHIQKEGKTFHDDGTVDNPGKDVTYNSKDTPIIESRVDLVAKFGYDKFERVNEVQAAAFQGYANGNRPSQAAVSPEILETYKGMTVDQLKKHAAGEEIDLAGCKTRDEIIARLAQAVAV